MQNVKTTLDKHGQKTSLNSNLGHEKPYYGKKRFMVCMWRPSSKSNMEVGQSYCRDPCIYAGNINLNCMDDNKDSLKYQTILAKTAIHRVHRLKHDDHKGRDTLNQQSAVRLCEFDGQASWFGLFHTSPLGCSFATFFKYLQKMVKIYIFTHSSSMFYKGEYIFLYMNYIKCLSFFLFFQI